MLRWTIDTDTPGVVLCLCKSTADTDTVDEALSTLIKHFFDSHQRQCKDIINSSVTRLALPTRCTYEQRMLLLETLDARNLTRIEPAALRALLRTFDYPNIKDDLTSSQKGYLLRAAMHSKCWEEATSFAKDQATDVNRRDGVMSTLIGTTRNLWAQEKESFAPFVEALLERDDVGFNGRLCWNRSIFERVIDVGENIKLLLGHPDVNLYATDKNGRTVTQLARRNGNTTFIKLFEERVNISKDPVNIILNETEEVPIAAGEIFTNEELDWCLGYQELLERAYTTTGTETTSVLEHSSVGLLSYNPEVDGGQSWGQVQGSRTD